MSSLNNQEFIRLFDKQITRMYFIQIMTNTMASFPFAAINLYQAITSQTIRSADQENIVQFIRLVAIWLFFISNIAVISISISLLRVRFESKSKESYVSGIVVKITVSLLYRVAHCQLKDRIKTKE